VFTTLEHNRFLTLFLKIFTRMRPEMNMCGTARVINPPGSETAGRQRCGIAGIIRASYDNEFQV
jgi:hypothetical protein